MSECLSGAEGYLTDVLDVIRNLLELQKYYTGLDAVSEDAERTLREKKSAIDRRHIFVLFAVYASAGALLTFIIAIISTRLLWLAPVLIILIPAVLIFISISLYKKKVLIPYEAELLCIKEDIEKKKSAAKQKIYTQKALYEMLVDRLSPECRHSLAVYIMQRAAHDKAVKNVFLAQDYYLKREYFVNAGMQDKDKNDETRLLSEKIAASKEEEKSLLKFLASFSSK